MATDPDYQANQRDARHTWQRQHPDYSLDSIDWYPVLTGSQSQNTEDVEWYSFPPTYGGFIQIVGYGNTQNDWNRILEVQFGQPESPLAA
jgi:hypothetical protein